MRIPTVSHPVPSSTHTHAHGTHTHGTHTHTYIHDKLFEHEIGADIINL